MFGIDALRLTAALAHTLPTITAVLEIDHGPDVVVGSDRRCLPDLSPCELRRVVTAERDGTGPSLSWVSSVTAVELGGPEVTEVIEDVVLAGGRNEPVLAFATLLGPLSTRAVLRDVGQAMLADGRVDGELLRTMRASTFHDEALDVTTVVVAEPGDGRWSAEARQVVLAAARSCRVAELIDSVTAPQ